MKKVVEAQGSGLTNSIANFKRWYVNIYFSFLEYFTRFNFQAFHAFEYFAPRCHLCAEPWL